CPDLMEQVELVMPGKTSPARHKRVVAIANGVGGDVAEVRARTRSRLLRHLDGFVSRKEDELWTVDVVRLDQNAIPGRIARTRNELRSWRVVTGLLHHGAIDVGIAEAGRIVDQVAIPLPEPRTVRSVLRHNLNIKVLPEVELPHEPFATEALVAGPGTANWSPEVSQPSRWRLARKDVEAKALHAELPRIERLTGGNERGIGLSAIG